MTAVLEVLAPGLLTTVQDRGRADLGHLGVPRAGACDPWSAAVANLLVGNDPEAATLELTLIGPELRVLARCVIGIAGTDLGGIVSGSGRRLEPGRSHALAEGDIVTFPGSSATVGARSYLALPGGVDAPVVLGSRSTCLVGRFGGLAGRAIQAGDQIGCLREPNRAPVDATWSATSPEWDAGVRVLSGPDDGPLTDLERQDWTVGSASDRMGLRLDGPPLATPADAGERPSHGVVPGTVQLPPDGRPIVLLADAQPTGGYPVPAVVATVDLPVIGQLRPGAVTRFVHIGADDARTALREQRAALDDGARRLRDAGRWDELWRSARG
jgi:biotin-dependent carboxylase-like uncharacterized protein